MLNELLYMTDRATMVSERVELELLERFYYNATRLALDFRREPTFPRIKVAAG